MHVSKSRLFYALLSMHTLMVMGTTILLVYTALVAPWSEPLLHVSIALLFLSYYWFGGVLDMRVYGNDSVIHQRIISGMACLRSRYRPTFYLLNANLQTLFAAVGRPTPQVTFERELVSGVYPDGEICRLDWCWAFPPSSSSYTREGDGGTDNTATAAAAATSCAVRRETLLTGLRNRRLPPSAERREGGGSVRPLTNSSSVDPQGNEGDHAWTDTKDGMPPPTSDDDDAPRAPVVILFHGLTGGSDDSNMHYLTQEIRRMGWHVVIPVRRGCGDDATMTVPKFYAYGGIEDTSHVVDYIAAKMRGHVILGVGLSAGSNILANYLGAYGARSRIQAAISVANGYCWDKGTRAICEHHPVWDALMSSIVYHTLFGRHVKLFDRHDLHVAPDVKRSTTTPVMVDNNSGTSAPPLLADDEFPAPPTTREAECSTGGGCKESESPHHCGVSDHRREMSVKRLKRVGSQREMDEAVSRRLHGFPSLEAFYRHQSCEHRLPNIAVPTIFLNALDDPLAHHLNIPIDALQSNPSTLLVTTASGGHLGWAEGLFPFRDRPTWMDRFVVQGLSTLHGLAEELQRTGRVSSGGSPRTSQHDDRRVSNRVGLSIASAASAVDLHSEHCLGLTPVKPHRAAPCSSDALFELMGPLQGGGGRFGSLPTSSSTGGLVEDMCVPQGGPGGAAGAGSSTSNAKRFSSQLNFGASAAQPAVAGRGTTRRWLDGPEP